MAARASALSLPVASIAVIGLASLAGRAGRDSLTVGGTGGSGAGGGTGEAPDNGVDFRRCRFQAFSITEIAKRNG